MKRLQPIVGLFLLLLWVPITAHCNLENVPGLEFLKCAADSEAGKDCDGDACAQLETATYKISDTHSDFLPPALTSLSSLLLMEFPLAEPAAAVIEIPPELSSGWQFAYRTALPPRAPSFVS